jgi:hypothetical protein
MTLRFIAGARTVALVRGLGGKNLTAKQKQRLKLLNFGTSGRGKMKQVVMTPDEVQDFADILYDFCNSFSLYQSEDWEENPRYLNLVSWAETFRQAHMRSRKVTVLLENKE